MLPDEGKKPEDGAGGKAPAEPAAAAPSEPSVPPETQTLIDQAVSTVTKSKDAEIRTLSNEKTKLTTTLELATAELKDYQEFGSDPDQMRTHREERITTAAVKGQTDIIDALRINNAQLKWGGELGVPMEAMESATTPEQVENLARRWKMEHPEAVAPKEAPKPGGTTTPASPLSANTPPVAGKTPDRAGKSVIELIQTEIDRATPIAERAQSNR